QRTEAGLPVLALAGYTNAGKSTLMNALTSAGVVSSNIMFATLDPTTRQVELPNELQVLLTDTVGFIQKLPTDLVAAFRATLGEIQEADGILHVLDVSHPDAGAHASTVEAELRELRVDDRPRLTVLNKVDCIASERLPMLLKQYSNAVAVSAITGFGLEALRRKMADTVTAGFVAIKVRIPYNAAQDVHLFHRRGLVEKEAHRSSGTDITGKLPAALIPKFEPYLR
ncbi:MAG TPA: GTPase, partial [Chloroflexota bacterium]|nr:GTPase [Chloroflexota bacterium]